MGDCRLGGLPFCESQRRIALRHRNGATQTSGNLPSARLGEYGHQRSLGFSPFQTAFALPKAHTLAQQHLRVGLLILLLFKNL
jgi:hypothetical protein